MQERYELLAANGCRNLQDFNRRVQDKTPLKTPRRKDVAFEDSVYRGDILPYIVVIIDEMADLMMTVQGEVETPIAMLAQKARAIGIHLILATQRPSVNVITGLIKANFPSRIAFRVAGQVDSRTIIDGAGAEMLLGNGDMLFIPPGKSEASRLQGVYLSSEETEKLMAWYEAQRDRRRAKLREAGLELEAEMSPDEPDILETVRTREAEMRAALEGGAEEGGADAGSRDPLFREAAELCIQNQSGSTSLLQRRLGIGYGRAARVIDQLADAGVLDAKSGPKGRECASGSRTSIASAAASEKHAAGTRGTRRCGAGDRVADRRAGFVQHTARRGRALPRDGLRLPVPTSRRRADAHGCDELSALAAPRYRPELARHAHGRGDGDAARRRIDLADRRAPHGKLRPDDGLAVAHARRPH